MEFNWNAVSLASFARIEDGPAIVERNDAEVQQRVLVALRERHYSTLQELEVHVLCGEVTVDGRVNSFYEKQIAISTCQQITGVQCLIDRIDVREIEHSPRLKPNGFVVRSAAKSSMSR